MKNFMKNFLKLEFETRIFVSFGIVLSIGLLSILEFGNSDSIIVLAGKQLGFHSAVTKSVGFILLAGLMVFVCLLRMWSGSLLTSHRVMAFKVQTDRLVVKGPYRLSRNPIYLSDLIALTGISFCFPPVGLLIPVLFYFHYSRLIKYEEESLGKNFSHDFHGFISKVPRFFPTPESLKKFLLNKDEFIITKDGFRHNALYILFIPGFILSAITNEFAWAIITGLPSVIDWGIVHTKIGLSKASYKNKKASRHQKVFRDILYSNCWEDPQIDREAFQIKNDDVVFSITSGGCNVLTFLIDKPSKVIALDLNKYQNFLLELKIAAFKHLTHEQVLGLLGIKRTVIKLALYKYIRVYLSDEAREYWDNNLNKIEKGIICSGRYENYMKLLRICLQLLAGKNLIREFFETEDEQARSVLFERKWNNLRWKIFTKIFLSKKVMSLLFTKDFFKYLEDNFSFGKHFSEKARHALTELPIKENYFLTLILLGHYLDEDYLPVYLKRENFETIKKNIDMIEIVTGDCLKYFESLPESTISKFNFTNIFEWISPEDFELLLIETYRAAKNNAVITYRNLLVPRKHPSSLDSEFKSSEKLAEKLHKKDLSFIYNNYVVEHIIKEKQNGIRSKNCSQPEDVERLYKSSVPAL